MAEKAVKTAEKVVTDADKFPIETCREKLARRFGIDAVALSGPCEGKALADCVCKQLSSRWDRVEERFAGNKAKIEKLAMRLAETFAAKESDMAECEATIQKLGYAKEAASGISGYLKAYAMPGAMDEMFNGLMDEVGGSDADEFSMEEPALPEEEGIEELPPEGEVPAAPEGDEMIDIDLPPDVADEAMGEEPMVEEEATIEVPQEVLTDLVDDLKRLEGETGLGGDLGGDLGMEEPGLGLEDDIIDLPAEEPLAPEATEIPGEPAAAQEPGTQVVEGDEIEKANMPMAPQMPKAPGTEQKPGMGEVEKAGVEIRTPESKMEAEPTLEEKHEEMHSKMNSEEKHEEHLPEEKHEEHEKHEDKHKEHEEHESKETEDEEEKEKREAAMNLRAGHIRKLGQSIRKLAPEMVLQDSDQLNPLKGKELGKAKEKAVEAPKPVADGNLETEGFSAGDKKFQDGGTMGHEQKFDAKEIKKEDVSVGDKSLMGPDESIPKDGPKVPAGSAPIGGETWQGGDVATKGTVIATLTPTGVMVAADGKRVLAKINIEKPTQEIKDAIAALDYDGDIRKFAMAARQVVRAKITKSDGISKVDTGKMEAEHHTNDAKKAPEGAAKTSKGSAPKKEEGETKTDNSKLEAEKHTNDAKKEPEDKKAAKAKVVVKEAWLPEGVEESDVTRVVQEGKVDIHDLVSVYEKLQDPADKVQVLELIRKLDPSTADMVAKGPSMETPPAQAPVPAMASSNKQIVKEAKPVEAPKPIADGNLETEGFSAGDKKFQDGKTMGHEQKFDPKEVKDSDVSVGEKSLMGKDESIPKDGPDVPAGGGKMGNEIFDGGNVATKGTVIAQEQKRAENEAKVREARVLAASAYAADLLRNGEISDKEYAETVQKFAEFPIQAIQRLALSTRQTREKMSAQQKVKESQVQQRVAGLATPIVITASNNEMSLTERLVKEFKLTKDLDKLDESGKK